MREEVVQYIGIAADEQERVCEFRYPLVDVVTAPAHRLVACSNNSRGVAAGDGLDEADGEVEHRAGAAEGYSLD